jgi:murein DD-endopeptidase MepM/ murein hydrolase activator NlpD
MFSGRINRRGVAGIVAALTVSIGAVAYDHVHAATTPPPMARLEAAATALKPAERLNQSGVIMFPMDPLPKCALSKTSFGQPRLPDRVHEGIDIMSGLGQKVYAVDNGVLWRQAIDGNANAVLSGNAWYVQLPDKTYFFYGHLSSFAPGLTVGDMVTRGQVIGYTGDTGNAGPLNYHLHFEVHPKGGVAVDPFPLLSIPKTCRIAP